MRLDDRIVGFPAIKFFEVQDVWTIFQQDVDGVFCDGRRIPVAEHTIENENLSLKNTTEKNHRVISSRLANIGQIPYRESK